MAYIIDTYNKFNKWDRDHSVYIFFLNENAYAIKEVQLEWGLPQIPMPIDYTPDLSLYQIYNTKEDALQFVKTMKMA